MVEIKSLNRKAKRDTGLNPMGLDGFDNGTDSSCSISFHGFVDAARPAVSGSYATGSSLDKMVGRYSATVGWICIARCTTVYGAFAYMTSSNT
jgi:hypothetical protein